MLSLTGIARFRIASELGNTAYRQAKVVPALCRRPNRASADAVDRDGLLKALRIPRRQQHGADWDGIRHCPDRRGSMPCA